MAALARVHRSLRRTAACALFTTIVGCGALGPLVELSAIGRSRELRDDDAAPARASRRPGLLILALDGVKRDVLYDRLRAGALPGLTALLGGGQGGALPHAYLHPGAIAPLPAVTIVGWSTIFTGAPPAVTGVTGNELFIREAARFVAPIPGSFEDAAPSLAVYTDDYANDLLEVPTVYERLRREDPAVRIWVAVSQFHRGADRLLIAKRTAIVGKAYATARDTVTWRSYASYAERDREILDNVLTELADDDEPVPDVLTVYLSGADSYAHVAPEGPDAALARFLADALDDGFRRLAETLARRGALADRWILVVADHGQSPVPEDGSTLRTDEPRAVLERAGFRVRPFALEVEARDFQAVLAYQGPFAYVYVADRSTCAAAEAPCDWRRPPRFTADVLPVAEAFWQANRDGRHAPAMRGTLDLILTRRPRSFAEDDLPFEVYAGAGRLVPIPDYLRAHPHPRWVAFEARLRDLAVGRYGERAGDVVLIARDGSGPGPAGRHYFNAGPQRALHGGASRADAEVPLIVAHHRRDAAALRTLVTSVVGERPSTRRITDLALHLRRR